MASHMHSKKMKVQTILTSPNKGLAKKHPIPGITEEKMKTESLPSPLSLFKKSEAIKEGMHAKIRIKAYGS